MLNNNINMNEVREFAKKLEGLYKNKFELIELIELTEFISSKSNNKKEHEDRVTKLKDELSNIDSLINNEIIRLYNREI